jgi:hypothetical protein
VNVAAGTLGTDAVNVNQLNNTARYFKAGGLNDGTDDAVYAGNSVAARRGRKGL